MVAATAALSQGLRPHAQRSAVASPPVQQLGLQHPAALDLFMAVYVRVFVRAGGLLKCARCVPIDSKCALKITLARIAVAATAACIT